MSNLQFGTLRYVINHSVQVEELGIYNLTTLGSLIARGWVERRATRIAATEKGIEAYMAYQRSTPNYRQHIGDISERVRMMLHISALRAVKTA